jgi:hypothetical protein
MVASARLRAALGAFLDPGELMPPIAFECAGPLVKRTNRTGVRAIPDLTAVAPARTRPTSRSTRRCFETDGCASTRASTMSETGCSSAARKLRIARRWGSATALNTSELVAARGTPAIIFPLRNMSSPDQFNDACSEARLAASGDTRSQIAGFSSVESVDTSTEMAGFATRSPGRPRPRTGIPAARK